MKIRHVLFTLALTATAFAQGFAPDSVGNKVVSVNIKTGTPPFAVSGTATQVFTMAGTWYLLTATGDVAPNQNGTYVYTKTGANTATLRSSQVGFGDELTTITFTSSIGGTFTSGFVGGLVQQTGDFTIAPFSTTAPLVNISTRIALQAGQSINPGFVVGGTVPRRVLIRAVGPGLGALGVPGTLPTPTLAVYSGQTQIAANAGWNSSLASTFAAVGAFGLTPGSKDAALLLTLNPGNYTALVGGGVGEVILEIYFVD